MLSPSIAFIKTPIGSGSGVLIEGGYVLTNAHVVWPYTNVRVVFPDGSEFPEAPVVEWDLMGDLALLGPVETSARQLELVDGEDLVIGSDTFLIGYPGEADEFPEPTITRGLISRLREWEPLGMTYFQTDAAIASGQSGGTLISAKGDVIGISGFQFTEAGFGLVASAADVRERIDMLIAGEDLSGFGLRRLPSGSGGTAHTVSIKNPWDIPSFLIDEPVGTSVQIDVTGDHEPIFAISDALGSPVFFGFSTLAQSDSFELEVRSPYFMITRLFEPASGSAQIRLSSSHRILPISDNDDNKNLVFGEAQMGAVDHPVDLDYFIIELAEGDTIEINVESLNIDPIIIVSFLGAGAADEGFDDDSGEGLFRWNARLEYTAPHSGSYFIVVADESSFRVGGYFLNVVHTEAESQSEAYARSLLASGAASWQLGDTEKAIELFSRAIELNPNLASAYQSRARAYYSDLGDYEQALSDINAAIELDSDNLQILMGRATVYWRKGDDAEALADLQTLRELDDEYADAYNLSALVNVSTGDLEQAILDVNTALQLRSRNNAYIRDTRAYVYLKRGEYDEAFSEYRSIREEFSGTPLYELGLGLTNAALGDADRARDMLADGLSEARSVEYPDPQLADLIAMAEAALESL